MGRNGVSTAHFGARAGSRILNLGIKRLPTDRLSTSHRVSARLTCIRRHDATVSGRLRECQGVSRLSCQTSCHQTSAENDRQADLKREGERPHTPVASRIMRERAKVEDPQLEQHRKDPCLRQSLRRPRALPRQRRRCRRRSFGGSQCRHGAQTYRAKSCSTDTRVLGQ